jgi:hypothetical protein
MTKGNPTIGSPIGYRQGTKHIVTMNKRTRQIKLSYYDEINLDADGKLIVAALRVALTMVFSIS